MKKTNEKMIKGYKGFSPGMICRGKQYSENATFEEEYAKPCVCGIHFCRYPLDVFNFYSPADEAGLNEFAEVETLSPVLTDDNIKFCSKKLYIKKRISLAKLCQAAVNFILANIDKINEDQKSQIYSAATNTVDRSAATNTGHGSAATNTGDWSAATNTGDRSAATNTGARSAATNTGYWSAATNTGDGSVATNTGDGSVATNTGHGSAATNTGARSAATNTGDWSAATNTGARSAATNTGDRSVATNTGDRSAATNTGDRSVATNTGDRSAAIVSGKKSIAVATGFNGKASGALGCWIACAEWEIGNNGIPQPIDFKAVYVDGEKIKADTYYMLKNGKFVEVKDA